jgi:hypothetical protein
MGSHGKLSKNVALRRDFDVWIEFSILRVQNDLPPISDFKQLDRV